MPRRPPRHPPSPSVRSRSLELLDHEEKKSVSPATETEVQARPRSRSLDGLLDEDGIVSEMKTEEPPKLNGGNDTETEASLKTLDKHIDKMTDDAVQISLQETENNADNVEPSSPGNKNPIPVPRHRIKSISETKSESVSTEQSEDKEKLLNLEESSEMEAQHPPARPPKPNRFVSVDTALSRMEDEKNESQASSEDADPCDSSAELKERLVASGNDKSTLLKAKSCGAGLDSDESISSNDYKPKSREQGSLLSLPTGAEPKRKKNFMDKCVNKVRSFMRK